ncbi:MAG: UDP-3-O-(3-hydroxymyristoyl)glucosamine N-acyltransferase [bacterium]|nr:UDP-3-O-(3-hydroxymyristoyl)glucosamine N-acyltransferase [bacterium]
MVRLADIANAIGAECAKHADIQISGMAAPQDVVAGQLTVVHSKQWVPVAMQSAAAAIITSTVLECDTPQLIVKDTRKAMAQALNLLYPQTIKSGIHPSAIVEPGASIGEHTYIGPNAVVYAGAKIGNNCRIDANAVIYENTEIGNNVIVYAGAVLGKPGFGYYRDEQGYHPMLHVAKLIIADNVVIGGNTAIDRGCLTDTVIGEGTIIDNMVHIAHNNKIGKHNAIAAHVAVAGSSRIGDNNQFAGQVGMNSDTEIGDNNIFLGKAGITKNLGSNGVYKGYPAQDHREETREQAALRRLVKKKK